MAKCKCGCTEEPRVVREVKPDTKTVVIRRLYCDNCGLFQGKYKFINGREVAYCMVQNGNNWTLVQIEGGKQ
jgi:hypothetical protein